ncbi:MAG TPA: DUF5689 domain-containing protein [Ferruginibacter sp.]|nr:DUF5689 domain-containing protein [Ferruginibacter sp.]HMP20422.1 DUF5689 domain-containing protein [Ferruginibacter sp.]
MQQKRTLLWLSSIIVMFAALTSITSCKKKFDAPPAAADQPIPDGYTQISLKDLKARHTTTGTLDLISDAVVLNVVVTANDKSGNLYKELFVRDETGSIKLLLDQAGLYGPYPVGRRLWVKCQGLYLSDESGLMVIGARAVISGVPQLFGIEPQRIREYVIGGSINNPVEPKLVTIADLGTGMQNQYIGELIKLENYQFTGADMDKTYADTSSYRRTVNLNVQNCTGATSQIIVRTSGFASFAGTNVPDGNGTLTAIYTVFGNTRQLVVRDTADVQFYGDRCGAGPVTLMNTAELRALYTGTTTAVPAGRKITGVVISDRLTNNITTSNLVIQQGNGLAGVLVRFSGTHSFNLGDSIDVNVSGQELSTFNSMLQVNNVPLDNATRISTGKTITPREITIADIATNIANIENTLVKIINATATGGTNYIDGTASTNRTLTDATGSFTLRTLGTASFGSSPLPTTCQNWVGYVSRFNTTNQLSIRSLSDVTTGSSCGVTPPPTGSGIDLGTTSPKVIDFNGIESGLPTGVKVYTAGTASSIGNTGNYNSAKALWNGVAGGFKNLASATGLTATSDNAAQDGSTNRALGIRQVANTNATNPGTDPGASFVFEINNTTGKSNMTLEFLLQSLDNTSGRQTTWTVDYATGDNPTTFTALTATGTLTTGAATFSSNTISVPLPAALNNLAEKVWIRIITLTAAPTTTGITNTNRATTAIDDFKISW